MACWPKRPFAVGDKVKVVQVSASDPVKQRIYQVKRINDSYELLQLEWLDAPARSKEKYLWILSDFVRLL